MPGPGLTPMSCSLVCNQCMTGTDLGEVWGADNIVQSVSLTLQHTRDAGEAGRHCGGHAVDAQWLGSHSFRSKMSRNEKQYGDVMVKWEQVIGTCDSVKWWGLAREREGSNVIFWAFVSFLSSRLTQSSMHQSLLGLWRFLDPLSRQRQWDQNPRDMVGGRVDPVGSKDVIRHWIWLKR